MKLNTTKFNDMIANAAARVKISSTIFKAFISDVKSVVDGHDDLIEAVNAGNKIINGDFSVNQRVKSGVVTLAAGAYGHDRWKAGPSGCTYTFVTSENVTTITITAGTLQQVIEGKNIISGEYFLSWEGTAQGRINSGSYGASGLSVELTGGTNGTVEFGTGTVSKVRLNHGTALPYQPRSFAEELALCQRYYEKSYNYDVTPGTAATSIGIIVKVLGSNSIAISQEYGDVQFKVPKRAVGTVTIYPFTTPSNTGRVSNPSSGADLGANSGLVPAIGTNSFRVTNGSGGTLTTGGNGIMFHYAADAEL